MSEPLKMNGQQQPPSMDGRREIKPTSAPQRVQAQAPATATRPPDELEVLIRARYPIIYVVTWEEERLEQRLFEIAKKRNKTLHIWTCSQGMVQFGAEPQRAKTGSGSTCDPVAWARRRAQPRRSGHLPVQGPSRSSRCAHLCGQPAQHPPAARRRPRAARHVQDDRARLAVHEDPGRALQGRRRGRIRHAVGRRLQRAARPDHRRRQGPAADQHQPRRRRP